MTLLASRAARFVLLAITLDCGARVHGQPARFNELNTQAVSLYKEGKYAAAAEVETKAVRVAEATFGPDDLRVAMALANLGSIYREQGRLAEAAPVYERSLTIREKSSGPADHPLAMALNDLAMVYERLGRYAEAEGLYRRALSIEEKVAPESRSTAAVMMNLAGLYKQQNRYGDAEPLYQRALDMLKRRLGPEDPAVAAALNSLAGLNKAQSRYPEAESLYQQSLAIREKALGPDSREVAASLNNLAAVYDDEGNFAAAEPLYLRALHIDEKALSPDDSDLALDLNNLGELRKELGRYAEAEPLYQRALSIQEKSLGSDNAAVGVTLCNLAGVYKREGRYDEAETLYLRALKIDEKALGPEHQSVATVLNNLAGAYQSQGRFRDAEPAFQRALKIDEKALGPDHPTVATDLNNLALLYGAEGKLADAEPLYQRTLRIDEKTLGADHPRVATVLNNLGDLARAQGKYPESEKAFLRALSIDEKALGVNHPDSEKPLSNLAVLYDAQGKYAEAETYYQRALENLFLQFQYSFSYMTEQQRLSFLATTDTEFPAYFSFVYRNHEKDPKLIGSMYDLLLWEKGFVASSIANMRRQIEASGDSQAIAMLAQLSGKRTEIAALLNSKAVDREKIDQLQSEADGLEKSLVARSSAYAEHQKLQRATWQQVRDALHPGEAAVEFAHFRYFENGWQDKSLYVALVVKHDTREQPQWIFLGEGKEMESAALTQLQSAVETRGLTAEADAILPGKQAYERIWQPLVPALKGVNRIYLSPDGVLNQLPLDIVPLPDGKLLMERYDLRLVSSTKDLLRHAKKRGAATALLVGDPEFSLGEADERAALQKLELAKHQVNEAVQLPSGGSRVADGQTVLPRLPGTGIEVSTIAHLMESHGWKSRAYTRELALKSVVEEPGGPRVLHLATHGFFQPDREGNAEPMGEPAGADDPMLRSGLYFAGADRALAGTPPIEGLDNGILTAMEAGNINLSGTELVVLSACNTGRGNVRNGEGVFGLRRALQEAGAESVLMSLWSVPDKETLELMQRFYAGWLAGKEMHKALKDAQLAMRKKVQSEHGGRDLPYYWGAFVLVGK